MSLRRGSQIIAGTGPQGASGAQGPQGAQGAGAQGPQGSSGAQGPQGFSNIVVVSTMPGSPVANTLYIVTT